MLPTTYRILMFVAALMLLGSGAAPAATVPRYPLPLRVPNVWARTASSSFSAASISTIASNPETFLYTFKSLPDGNVPAGGLIAGEDGSLYGTAAEGGLSYLPTSNPPTGAGTVFKLTPNRRGGYTESSLYLFGTSGVQDGAYPQPTNPLARDCTGALYGTTSVYGTSQGGFFGPGTVYKLTPTTTGYRETILYSFPSSGFNAPLGGDPQANPILDRSGALYGTTFLGGSGLSVGVVYKLTPTKSGYTFSLLHVFQASSNLNDGYEPRGGLTLDPRTGDLYGTTSGYGNVFGSNPATGAVFKLHPSASGYVYSIIHIFQGPDGGTPSSNVIMDRFGALYGTAENGGASFGGTSCTAAGGCGAVFKLTPTRTGYVESLLYSFTGGLDGSAPFYGLVADRLGNLYSTTSSAGQYGNGTVFELARTSTGYREVTLHEFTTTYDGLTTSGVLLDRGHLLGETWGASQPAYENGTIYALW